MDDEREELAEKEYSYEWILFFLFCMCVSLNILMCFLLFFCVGPK